VDISKRVDIGGDWRRGFFSRSLAASADLPDYVSSYSCLFLLRAWKKTRSDELAVDDPPLDRPKLTFPLSLPPNFAMPIPRSYGAVILSFLGAMHWGLEFAKYGGEQGNKRLALGVLPLAVAWPTLYLADPAVALIAQWGGFLVSWVSDRWATGQGWSTSNRSDLEHALFDTRADFSFFAVYFFKLLGGILSTDSTLQLWLEDRSFSRVRRILTRRATPSHRLTTLFRFNVFLFPRSLHH